MLTVLVILAVLGILFGAAVLATYEGDVLKDPHPDDLGVRLPATHVQPEDVAELRFDMALRGYRMAEVDDAMARLGAELAARDARIAELEQALVDVVEPAVTAAEQQLASVQVDLDAVEVAAVEPEQTHEEPPAAVEAYEPLEPPTVAPAAISGPLTATTWFTEPVPEPVDVPAPEPVASAPVDVPTAEVEQTQEPEPAPEPVVSAPEEAPAAEAEQTQEAEPPAEEAQEPEAFTLPASDEAFSFPELQPPDAADEDAPMDPQEWWQAQQERPGGEGH